MYDFGKLLQQNVVQPADDLRQQILNSPRGRQALVQAGLNLLQPVGFGQSGLGHIGQAIGGAMEARDRGIEADIKAEDRERARKIQAENQALRRSEVGIRREGLGLRKKELAQRYGLNKRKADLDEARLGLDERRVGAEEQRAEAALIRAKNPRLRGARTATDYLQQDMLRELAKIESDITMEPPERLAAQQRVRDAYTKAINGELGSTGDNTASILEQAREAIAAGAPREAIRQRLLEDYGIDLEP